MVSTYCYAQQYTGMTGLIHTPTAEMDKVGDVRIGAHFLNKEMTPDAFNYNGKYNTLSYYLSVTPFSWVEIGYTCTMQKGRKNEMEDEKIGFYFKDRYFSLKIRPLKEGKWYPAIALGTNDPAGKSSEGMSGDGKSLYFSNFYIAATKHINIKNHQLGIHVSYRKWNRSYNQKWNGLVGGFTFSPSFTPDLKLICEYDGEYVNAGADYLLFKYLLLQASLQNGKYISGGICWHFNLL